MNYVYLFIIRLYFVVLMVLQLRKQKIWILQKTMKSDHRVIFLLKLIQLVVLE